MSEWEFIEVQGDQADELRKFFKDPRTSNVWADFPRNLVELGRATTYLGQVRWRFLIHPISLRLVTRTTKGKIKARSRARSFHPNTETHCNPCQRVPSHSRACRPPLRASSGANNWARPQLRIVYASGLRFQPEVCVDCSCRRRPSAVIHAAVVSHLRPSTVGVPRCR